MTPKHNKRSKTLLTKAHHDFERGLNARAFFKVSDRTISQDLVQDTFLKTWKYLAKGGKIDTMKAFLYHILNNLIVDHYRKHKTSSLDALMEKGYDPTESAPERTLDILDGQLLFRLIKKLPKTYQRIMLMRYIKEMSLSEISKEVGISKNSVTVRTHRGLKRLRLLYKVR